MTSIHRNDAQIDRAYSLIDNTHFQIISSHAPICCRLDSKETTIKASRNGFRFRFVISLLYRLYKYSDRLKG